MKKPLVSVIIPVYNAGNYLRSSLESILNQTYSNLEIILVNDGSADNCMESIADIKDSRVRVISQQNSGRAVAMNRGLDELSGDFYIAHDADDINSPYRVELQVKCLRENSDLAAVFVGNNLIINGKIVAPRLVTKTIEQCRKDIDNFRMPGHGPTPMYRVSMVSDIRFEPTLKVAEDVDYILRIGERFPLMVLGECLYSYRVHLDSSSRLDPTHNQLMVARVIERACQRRGLDPAKYLPLDTTFSTKFSYRHREAVVPHFMESVLDLRSAGRYWESLKTAFTCLKLHPLDLYYYKPLCYFLAPMKLIRHHRSRKAKAR